MTAPRTGSLGVLSATGSMLYRDANGEVTDLPRGDTGEILTLAGNVPVWGQKEVWSYVETNQNYSSSVNMRVRDITGTGNFNFNIWVPHDFNALVSMELIGVPNANFGAVGAIDLESTYGTTGEPVANHNESVSLINLSGTLDQWLAFDVSGAFTNLAALDRGGYNVDHDSGLATIMYIGTRLRYT